MGLLLHRAQRVKVVRLIPGPAHVRARRNDIGEGDEALAIGTHYRDLMVPGMTAGDGRRHPGNNLDVTVDTLDHPLDPREAFGDMAERRPQPPPPRISVDLQLAH